VGVKFFGRWLVERGVISVAQLDEAVAVQRQHNLRLGEYAVRAGYLGQAQPKSINWAQRADDERFGQMAVKMGLLTRAQVDHLLAVQKGQHVRLGEALMRLGHLDEDRLAEELRAFDRDQERYGADEISLGPDGAQAALVAAVLDMTRKMFLRVAGMSAKLGEVQLAQAPPARGLRSVRVAFTGDLRMDCVLSVPPPVAAAIARGFLGDTGNLTDEVVIDCVKELCNIICGNAAGKFDRPGHLAKITPPSESVCSYQPGDKVLLVPIHVVEGVAELRLSY
jgi:CheY-specific phosphatase CheX